MLKAMRSWARAGTVILAVVVTAAWPPVGRPSGTAAAAVLPPKLAPVVNSPWLFPHFAESPGGATGLTVYAFYTAGLAGIPSGSGAMVDLYLYSGSTGAPLKSGTNLSVCNPCSAPLSTVTRGVTFSVESLILANGGFPAGAGANIEGYGIIEVNGVDAGQVAVQVIQKENSAVYELPTSDLEGNSVGVVPHFAEAPGTLTDVVLYLAYGSGQASLPSGSGATEDIYILTDNGQPLKSGTNLDICNPCSFSLSTSLRHVVFRLEDQIAAAGGLNATVSGTALLVTSGADPAGLARLAVQHSPFATTYLPLAQR